MLMDMRTTPSEMMAESSVGGSTKLDGPPLGLGARGVFEGSIAGCWLKRISS